MTAAIFDLDGTLYAGHIGWGITRHHRTHRVKAVRTALHLDNTCPARCLYV
jgi:hypothetical protein